MTVRTIALAEFLAARLDEDETLWLQVDGEISRLHADLYLNVRTEPEPGVVQNRRVDLPQPPRMLREVAAKRAIVAEAFHHAAVIDGEWGCCHEPDEIRAGKCRDTNPDEITLLRHLAAIYSDHPDYRDEWRA